MTARRRIAVCLPLAALALAPARAADPSRGPAGLCQQQLGTSGGVLVEQYLGGARACALAAFQCVQDQPGDARCLARAHDACLHGAPWLAGGSDALAAAFERQVNPACGVLEMAELLGPEALGHAAGRCGEFGVALDTPGDLARCVALQHRCRALALLGAEMPRAGEMLGLAGFKDGPAACVGAGMDARGKAVASASPRGRPRPVRQPRNAREASRRASRADDPGPTAASAICQDGIARTGQWFARDWQKFVRPCLEAEWACTQQPAAGRAACQASARALCAAEWARVTGATRGLRDQFVRYVSDACGASRLPAADLLRAEGLGFAAHADACARAGVPALEDAGDVAACLVRRVECGTARIVARQVPRAPELLAAAGIDAAVLACATEETVTATCGDGVPETGEECDPPGSFAACGGALMCGDACTCAVSRPPVLTLDPPQATVPAGGTVAISVAAEDPDGDPVTVAADPLAPGLSFDGGTLSYAAPPGTAGPLFVTVVARDPHGLAATRVARIDVTGVNRPPELSVPPGASVAEGGVLALAVTATDPDGDELGFTVAPEPLPDHAVFVAATGTLSFTPDYGQAGTYTFTFRVSDGQAASAPAACVVTVTDVPAGDPGEPSGLTLEVDRAQSPTLLPQARLTGRVNPVAGAPVLPPRATSALVTALLPNEAEQGATRTVELLGATSGDFATHFEDGVSSADFGAGISVTGLTVTGPASATATIAIAATARPGPRTVSVATGTETALGAVAFRVGAGVARVRGRIVDAASAAPLAGAYVGVAGNPGHATSAADGTFFLDALPAGRRTVIVNAADHELVTVDVDAPPGVVTELGDVRTNATVFDPSLPAAVSLHGVLGRGLADLSAQPAVDVAKQVVIDALLLVGGDEAGVLDAYGRQLNPDVSGTGLVSLSDQGARLFAERMAGQASVPLLEVLGQLSFGLAWSGSPPTVAQWLTALQAAVNEAWTRPNDAASQATILVFSAEGRRLSPDPPTIAGETRLTRFQAWLMTAGISASFARNRATWSAGGAATPAGRFSGPWTAVLNRLPAKPTGPRWSTVAESRARSKPAAKDAGQEDASGPGPLPDFEDLVASYYLDQSEEALTKARDLLLTTFPGIGLEPMFEDDPLGVRRALDTLIALSAGDVALRNDLQRITGRNADGTSQDQNLWSLFEIQSGPAVDQYFGQGYVPDLQLWPKLIYRSWAPNPPYIHAAREATRTLGDYAVPAVRITFHPGASTFDGRLYYRLWRIVRDPAAETARPGNKPNASMVLVGFGSPDDGGALAPVSTTDGSGRLSFELLLPPAGMNQYRMDTVRYVPLRGALSAEDLQRVQPWMAGYLDDPVTVPAFSGLGPQHLHAGTSYLHGDRVDVSALSNTASVYVGGQGSGLAKYGRIDLVADPQDSSKVYLGLPGFAVDDDPLSRATGTILRFDSRTGEAAEHVRPGFMTPGQIGLALDENGNLFTDNAASDAAYGGRIFRFLGPRNPDAPFDPAYPTDGSVPDKWFAGSVNYYSRMIQRAQPCSVQAMTFGPGQRADLGDDLFVVDLASYRIKRLPIHAAEALGWDAWHVNGLDWAWSEIDDTLPLPIPPRDQLGFGPETDLAWDPLRRHLYVTRGGIVLRTPGGRNASSSITYPEPVAVGGEGPETLFQLAAGVAVCEANGEDVLFVSDRAAGTIYRIPTADLPLEIPRDETARAALRGRYAFLTGLAHPGPLRITDRGEAMVFADQDGVRYQKFGFTGQALDRDGAVLAGARITVTSPSGTETVTADADGYYTFLSRSDEAVIYATVEHARARHLDRVTLMGRCNANLAAAPCVLVTTPADEAVVTTATVTVRGTILPASVDFRASGGVLEVSGAATGTYPLVFEGDGNDFVVRDVALGEGENALVARSNANTPYAPGGSLVARVRRGTAEAPLQAAAGALRAPDGSPLSRVSVVVSVDGVAVAETTTDSCGFWTLTGLPPGAVTAAPKAGR